MRTDLDHLPETKRQELELALEILFRAFDAATQARTTAKRQGRILKVVLFGSYARGDWVDDPVGGYRSDYDLLVVVSSDELTDVAEYWVEADTRLQEAYEVSHRLTAPAQFIVHSLSEVNRELGRGRPFFTDIVRDGVLLYQSDDKAFARPAKLSPAEAFSEAQEHFDRWFESASRFLVNGTENAARGWSNEAAFSLHQATERLYHCTLLTQTLYSPKSHNLNFLRGQAERVAPELIPSWPRGNRFEKRTWELLRRAYVEARFSKHYQVSAEELAWLAERIANLSERVSRSCQSYLASIRPTGDV